MYRFDSDPGHLVTDNVWDTTGMTLFAEFHYAARDKKAGFLPFLRYESYRRLKLKLSKSFTTKPGALPRDPC